MSATATLQSRLKAILDEALNPTTDRSKVELNGIRFVDMARTAGLKNASELLFAIGDVTTLADSMPEESGRPKAGRPKAKRGPSKEEIEKAREFTMPFGKFQGDSLGDIEDENPQYIDWLLSIELRSPLKEMVEAVVEGR